MVANHSTFDRFLQVSLFGGLGGKGAVVIATDMDAGIVSRHLCGHDRRWRISKASLGRLRGVSRRSLCGVSEVSFLQGSSETPTYL
jgi:hypothetical protein